VVFNTGPYTVLPDNCILITANVQSVTGFLSSHKLKSYVASKSRLKLAARAVLSVDAGLLVNVCYAFFVSFVRLLFNSTCMTTSVPAEISVFIHSTHDESLHLINLLQISSNACFLAFAMIIAVFDCCSCNLSFLPFAVIPNLCHFRKHLKTCLFQSAFNNPYRLT